LKRGVSEERFEKGRAKESLEKDGVKGGGGKGGWSKSFLERLEKKIGYIF
jgi:hypothetical protein